MGMENKNFLLAMALSLLILLAWQWIVPTPKKPAMPPVAQTTTR